MLTHSFLISKSSLHFCYKQYLSFYTRAVSSFDNYNHVINTKTPHVSVLIVIVTFYVRNFLLFRCDLYSLVYPCFQAIAKAREFKIKKPAINSRPLCNTLSTMVLQVCMTNLTNILFLAIHFIFIK